ncbi:hypothetical protein Efla_001942 [Eimeria flavescens]
MALLRRSEGRGAKSSSSYQWMLKTLCFFMISVLQGLQLQVYRSAAALEGDFHYQGLAAASRGKNEDSDAVASRELSSMVSPNEHNTPSHEAHGLPDQEHPGRDLDEKWFRSISNGGQPGDQEETSSREYWIAHDVPPELAADSSASIERPKPYFWLLRQRLNVSVRQYSCRRFDLLRKAAALFGGSPWLLTRDNAGANAGHSLAVTVGSALNRIFPKSQQTQRDGASESLRLLGTWAANSVELILADFGAGAYGLTVVPMHPDMNTRRFLEVMIHTQMTHLCTDWRHLEVVLDLMQTGQLPNLSTIISLDAVGAQAVLRARELKVTLLQFWDLIEISKARHRNSSQHGSAKDDRQFVRADIHAILYPRALSMPFNGTMLSNENILASLQTLTYMKAEVLAIVEEDRALLVDSFASIHQRALHLAVIQAGATAAFTRTGVLSLQEDVALLQPTVVSATGGILPLLHAAARRILKRMGRLRRFIILLKLRWRARAYWHMGDMDLLARAPFQEIKGMLASVHTLFVAPALASSELVKELQLLYSVIIVHACCSPETGIAFSNRQQNGTADDPRGFERIRASPLGWASPVLKMRLETLNAPDEAGLVEFHADETVGRQNEVAQLILSSAKAAHNRMQLSAATNDFARYRPSVLTQGPRHAVNEGEVVIQGACVSVGYYRHQTAFQRHLTTRGMYKTGLVAISAGAELPLLLVSTLSRNVLTAAGEFIDLEEAERKLRKVPIVRRVMLYADDFHSPLVAIIEPRRSAVIRWARRRFAYSDDYGSSYENLVSLPALRDFVLKEIEEHTWLTLETFELPKSIFLVPHKLALPLGEFEKDLDHKHISRSISRRQLAEAYAEPIRKMYASISE